MELWHQILSAALIIMMLFFVYPRIKHSMEQSRQAEEKHWGSFMGIIAVLIAFILLLIWSVQ